MESDLFFPITFSASYYIKSLPYYIILPLWLKNKWQQYLAAPPHQEMESISPPLGSEFMLAYFSQWDVHKYEYSRGLKITCTLGFSLGTQILCEKVQAILLYAEDMWPTHTHHSSPVSKGVQDQTVPGQLSCSLLHASNPGETNPNGSQTYQLIMDSFKQLSKFRSSLLHSSRQLIQPWSFLSDVLFCIP